MFSPEKLSLPSVASIMFCVFVDVERLSGCCVRERRLVALLPFLLSWNLLSFRFLILRMAPPDQRDASDARSSNEARPKRRTDFGGLDEQDERSADVEMPEGGARRTSANRWARGRSRPKG